MDNDRSHSDRAASGQRSEAQWGPRCTTRAPDADPRFDVPLRGVEVGPETRCAHYHGSRDLVAIRFSCCNAFYPCHACHEASTGHAPERWTADRFDTLAILCGKCGTVLTIHQYLNAGATCPSCGTGFNPGCARHHGRYFEVH